MSTPLEVNRLLGSLDAQCGGLEGTHYDIEKSTEIPERQILQPGMSGLDWLFNITDLQ